MIIYLKCDVPQELELEFMTHIRDFDTTHANCHFVVVTESDDNLKRTFSRVTAAAASLGLNVLGVVKKGSSPDGLSDGGGGSDKGDDA